ncbi:sensor domain-containing diguanylate cyclase [Halomonas sp. N3-2A]|uniref:sensor domain-containing diguanylate cyclase n=1 Tax=Halomonas sp. N3-2A TaxID=2014541 RepID=UPI000B5B2D6D|nr:diguanylate cyclase [Halomonas sp. N3-2A]ASK17899.1 diguanylate cyclase [Halomonas sp. N3-2A]
MSLSPQNKRYIYSRFGSFLKKFVMFSFTTLRGRLLLGAAALWGLLCVILLTSGWQAGRLLVNETNHQHLRYEAELISNTITLQVNERLTELGRLAQGISMPIEGALNAQHAHIWGNLFEALILFDLQSQIVDEWPVDGGRKGAVLADRDYARFMQAFKTPHISEPLIGRITGSPLILMLTPLYDAEGSYTGFLGGLVNIKESRLFKNFDSLRLGDDGYVTITAASRQRIYAPHQQEAIVTLPKNISPILEQALIGWEGESVENSLSGERQLVAYRQVWPANWIVGVHLPQAQAEAPLIAGMEKISSYAWGGLILIFPLVGGGIWLALRPLSQLAKQVRELQAERRSLVDIPTRMSELRRVIDVINETESARQTNLRNLAERKAELRATLAVTPQGMFITDKQGKLTFINDALYQLLGADVPHDLFAWSERIHTDDDQHDIRDAWLESLSNQSNFTRQFRFQGAGKELYWLDVHTAAIHVEGGFIGIVGTVRDVTQHQQDYAQKRWEAEHDPLTGLLNRRGLTRHLEEALFQWKTTGKPTAVFLFDLDHFKPINDNGGHSVGDLMLQQVAETIQSVVRSSDHVARQGGDEFAVLLNGCTFARAVTIAETLRSRIASCSVEFEDQRWCVTASIGVSHFQASDETIEAVLDRADAASYQAKHGGRNKVVSDSM